MKWRDLSECGARTTLDGDTRLCVRITRHDGLHQDISGQAWETEHETLDRLRARWGHRWHIVCTGRTWIATTYRRPGHRTQVESAPTPEQLEEQLARAPAPRTSAPRTTPRAPLVPAPRNEVR
ncbi:hypothetical protein [Nocardiopsis xinjiangensis]|uniref:hypothetical protein n=1 Tax=Nocardiopsis xinjiangensis TaxID=124285 RepID=UPI000349915C|nr:hypothetical protein [Nocardiopsis xinjiangensis]